MLVGPFRHEEYPAAYHFMVTPNPLQNDLIDSHSACVVLGSGRHVRAVGERVGWDVGVEVVGEDEGLLVVGEDEGLLVMGDFEGAEVGSSQV